MNNLPALFGDTACKRLTASAKRQRRAVCSPSRTHRCPDCGCRRWACSRLHTVRNEIQERRRGVVLSVGLLQVGARRLCMACAVGVVVLNCTFSGDGASTEAALAVSVFAIYWSCFGTHSQAR